MLVAFPTVAGTAPAMFSSETGACRYSQDQNVSATTCVGALFSKSEAVTKNTPQSLLEQ